MKTAKRIIKNTAATIAGSFLTPFISFILLLYISRVLGVKFLGEYAVIIAFFQVIRFTSFLGLHIHLIKEVAKNKDKTSLYISNALLIGIFTSAIVFFAVRYASSFLGYSLEIENALHLLSYASLFAMISLVFRSVFNAYERMEINAFISAVENLIRVLLCFFFLYLGYGVKMIVLSVIIAKVCSNVMEYIFAAKICGYKFSLNFNKAVVTELLRNVPVFLGIIIFSALIQRIDFILLSKLSGMEAVGYYTVAYRLYEIVAMFSAAFIMAIFPIMSKSYGSDGARAIKITSNASKYFMPFVIIISVIMFSYARDIIILVFSDKYIDSVLPLRILIWSVLFTFLDNIFAGLIMSAGRADVDLKVLFIGFINYAILLFFLIPRCGVNGAAAASLIASLLLFAARYIYASFIMRDTGIIKNLLVNILLGIPVVILSVWLKGIIGYFAAPVIIFLYFAGLIYLRIIDLKEIRNFRKDAYRSY